MSQKLSRHGLAVNTVIQTSSSMLLDLVEAGLGYVVMPGCALTLRGHNVQAVRIEGLTTVWTFGRLKTRPRPAAMDVSDPRLREAIGRAGGRDRVCRDVVIRVGRGTSNK